MASKLEEGSKKIKKADFWKKEIASRLKKAEGFHKRSEKLVKLFKDEKGTRNKKRLNIFCSNVKTLQPAIYSRVPKIVADRRYKDSDPVTRDACELIDRATSFYLDAYDFDSTAKYCRDDRLIVGRGVGWVKYEYELGEPLIVPKTEISLDEQGNEIEVETGEFEEVPTISFEKVCAEYVYWEDFIHSASRTWENVTYVGRRSYLNEEELEALFGDKIADQMTLSCLPESLEGEKESEVSEEFKRSEVWEIWNKTSKKVIYLSKDYPDFLIKEIDPPLNLKGFFPCSKPLFSTLTTDSLEPVPDYCAYQDQAESLDNLIAREHHLVSMLKVVGVRDASSKALDLMLRRTTEGDLIPIENYHHLSQNGGIRGVVDFMPLSQIVEALKVVREQIAKEIEQIYQISGISDIIRGYSSPNETATAQQIKGQWASIRLQDMQSDMSRFLRDLVALMAEVICEVFSEETLMQVTGLEFVDGDQERYMQALALLRDDKLRTFKIDIETDSTIITNEKAEQEAAGEYINATATFLEKFLPFASQFPSFAPVMGEMMMLGARKYRAGRGLEGALEKATAQFTEQLNAPQEPQPDPAMKELELKAQNNQAMLEQQERKIQGELQLRDKIEQGKLNQIYERSAAEIELERAKQEREFAINIAKMEAENERKTLQEARRVF